MKPYYSDKWVTIYHGDCREVLPALDTKVDLVLTDPPYFMPAVHYETRKVFQRCYGDLSILQCFFDSVATQIQAIVKDMAIIYLFCDGQSYPIVYKSFYGFTKYLRPLIWDKKVSINGYGWRHQHELILFATLPLSEPVKTGDGDILRFNAEQVDSREHPAQKPLDLISALISKSTKDGDLVLDPFAGSGTTLVAAKKLNRYSIGIEIEERYCEIAAKRCSQEVMELVY